MKEHNDPRLDQHLAICRRLFERMKRDGTWLWTNVEMDEPAPSSQLHDNSKPSHKHDAA